MDYIETEIKALAGDGLFVLYMLQADDDKCVQELRLRNLYQASQADDSTKDKLILSTKVNGGGAISKDVTLYLADASVHAYVPLVTIEDVSLSCD